MSPGDPGHTVMSKKMPSYTLVKRDPDLVTLVGGHPIRMQLRGPRIDPKEHVVMNGTLREVLDYARANHGEEFVQELVDEAMRLQGRTSEEEED